LLLEQSTYHGDEKSRIDASERDRRDDSENFDRDQDKNEDKDTLQDSKRMSSSDDGEDDALNHSPSHDTLSRGRSRNENLLGRTKERYDSMPDNENE
jgi:hypothetical protein